MLDRLEPLVSRKAQIAKRLVDLDSRAEKIARERGELQIESDHIDITLRTLAQFGLVPDAATEIKAGKVTGGASTKPEGTPILFEMVSEIFRDWDILDVTHEAQDIYDEIKKRWWPDAPRNSIIPSLWRFAEEKRIVKDGTKYGPLQKEETPGAETPSASNFEEDLDDEIPF